MADMVFNSKFPQKEIEKEIEVIIDEIHSYEDSPPELIFDEFENKLFAGTPLGHNILGTESSLVSFDTNLSKRFFEKFYIPQNAVFFFMGKTPFKQVLKTAEKLFSEMPHVSFNNERSRIIKNEKSPFHERIFKDTSQVHVIMGAESYNYYDSKRTPLYLLNNILGGPCMNSRLNMALREKKGYVYNVESNMTSYSDTGLYTIYFGTDRKHLDKCLNIVYKELNQLQKSKLSTAHLHAAKKQMMGQIALNRDNNENIALATGKSFLCYNHYESIDETFAKIDRIKSEDLLDVANEILDRDKISSLIFE
jgi:predicted Zn-dependent peptidase